VQSIVSAKTLKHCVIVCATRNSINSANLWSSGSQIHNVFTAARNPRRNTLGIHVFYDH